MNWKQNTIHARTMCGKIYQYINTHCVLALCWFLSELYPLTSYPHTHILIVLCPRKKRELFRTRPKWMRMHFGRIFCSSWVGIIYRNNNVRPGLVGNLRLQLYTKIYCIQTETEGGAVLFFISIHTYQATAQSIAAIHKFVLSLINQIHCVWGMDFFACVFTGCDRTNIVTSSLIEMLAVDIRLKLYFPFAFMLHPSHGDVIITERRCADQNNCANCSVAMWRHFTSRFAWINRHCVRLWTCMGYLIACVGTIVCRANNSRHVWYGIVFDVQAHSTGGTVWFN